MHSQTALVSLCSSELAKLAMLPARVQKQSVNPQTSPHIAQCDPCNSFALHIARKNTCFEFGAGPACWRQGKATCCGLRWHLRSCSATVQGCAAQHCTRSYLSVNFACPLPTPTVEVRAQPLSTALAWLPGKVGFRRDQCATWELQFARWPVRGLKGKALRTGKGKALRTGRPLVTRRPGAWGHPVARPRIG